MGRLDSDVGFSGYVDQTGGGSAPTKQNAAECGQWVCAVCYYTENKVGNSKCFICGASNPDSRDSLVVHECPNCSFLNSEFAISCEMCGTKLHGAKVPPSSAGADSVHTVTTSVREMSSRRSTGGGFRGDASDDDDWVRR